MSKEEKNNEIIDILCAEVFEGKMTPKQAAKILGWPKEVFDEQMVYWIGG